jgi:hypothetical protein
MKTYIASFDIGKVNFAFYVEEIDTGELENMTTIPKNRRYKSDGTPTEDFEKLISSIYLSGNRVLYKNLNLTGGTEKSKYLDPKIYHNMIKELYYNIFKMAPNMDLIKKIPEDFYAPCVIAQQFIELYERYSKIITQKQKDIEQILIDLANHRIKTSQDKIKDYLKKLEFYNKEKIH